jgi:hypothetical protein
MSPGRRNRATSQPKAAQQPGIGGTPSERELESHYDAVVEALQTGKVNPFLGAGVNLCGRPEGMAWKAEQYLPDGRELARHLAGKRYPEVRTESLVRVSQYYAVNEKIGPLRDKLHNLFAPQYPPTAVHNFLAKLPRTLERRFGSARYQVIITTNYDNALEDAFDALDPPEPYDVVWYASDGEYQGKFWHKPAGGTPDIIRNPMKHEIALGERTVILKIHGGVDRDDSDRDGYVITEDHYIDFLTRTELNQLIPPEILATFKRSRFLFLGYSLNDWNMRVILLRIWQEQEFGYASWAIQKDPTVVEQVLWNSRGVKVLNIPLETYIDELSRRIAPRGRKRAPPAR